MYQRDFRDVAFGESTFVAVGACGDYGIILTSSDNGTTWDNRTTDTTKSLYGVTYGNGEFVAVGIDGTILTSSDNGTTWTSRTSGTSFSSGYGLRGVIYSQ